MERKQAAKLIKDTFENAFSEEQLLKLLINVFNDFDASKTMGPWQGNRIFQPFRDHISSFKRIGQYRDPQGHLLDVLTVKVNQGTKLDRARTTLRNLAIEYLKGRNEVSQHRDTVLVAFYAEDTSDWRLSFIKLETLAYRDGDGKVKTKDQITSARRYSFLVGQNEPSHTAQQQLLPLLQDTFNNPTLAQLEEAFNIEKVTKEFFGKYRDLFLKVQEHLENLLKKDKTVRGEFTSKTIETAAFAKKLLGQIVFLYFIQKKGWLGVPKDKNFGEGDKAFLKNLFKKANEEGKNYFNDYLELLFYEALAVERKSADPSWYKPFNCRIPFLNGGLFEPIADYNWQDTEILIPNDMFSNTEVTKEGDIGTGILDVFDRYNFTVKEDEPLEKEVAVDPEMLGKVFENLLEVKDRKSKGTYYTPREIVHYMCQESLTNYLDTALNSQQGGFLALVDTQYDIFGNTGRKGQLKLETSSGKTVIPREDIEDFIKHSHLVVNDTRQDKKTFQLPDSIQNNAVIFDRALEKIKICDPAIGSGAFPVGLLTEIVNARQALTQFMPPKATNSDRTPYHLKRQCIHNSIYGVDIDPSAIDVAKLRLWLSLVVDEDSIIDIDPLPNLDYKIVCGNSLLRIELNLFNKSLLDELEEKKKVYFDVTNQTEKKKLHKQIDKLILEITNGKKEFDFEIYFSEVWHNRDGFDIVIGNPPYIVLSKDNFKSFKLTQGNSNTYVAFIEKGISLLSNDGFLTYIIPTTWLAGNNFKDLRIRLLEKHYLDGIVQLPYDMFESAYVDNLILFVSRMKKNRNLVRTFKFDIRSRMQDNIQYKYFNIDDWCDNSENVIFLSSDLIKILKRYRSVSHVKLDEIADVQRGTLPPKENELFTKMKKGLIPWFNHQVYRYKIEFQPEQVFVNPDHLLESKPIDLFECKKILGRQLISRKFRLQFAFLNKTYAFKKNLYAIYNLNEKKYCYWYIIAILNSSFYSYIQVNLNTSGQRNDYPAFSLQDYRNFFLPKLEITEQKPFSILSQYIFFSNNCDDNANASSVSFFDQLIDGMVFELYFEEELKNAGRDILKYLPDLMPITEDMTDRQKLNIIESEFNRLYNKDHPVRNNLFYMDSIPEIRIIKGLDTDANYKD